MSSNIPLHPEKEPWIDNDKGEEEENYEMVIAILNFPGAFDELLPFNP